MSRSMRRNLQRRNPNIMRDDASARRLYGPLWPVLADIWALHPNTNGDGLASLVALCAGQTDQIDEFIFRLQRPRPGGLQSAYAYMNQGLTSCDDTKEAWTVDAELVSWVGDTPDERLWAIVGLVWGLTRYETIASHAELSAISAPPRALEVRGVVDLANAGPQQIPQLLISSRPIDVVCSSYAADLGVSADASIKVTLPAALSATAATFAADRARGVAACALLIRADGIDAISPATLVSLNREGTAAHSLARLLSRLWTVTTSRANPATPR